MNDVYTLLLAPRPAGEARARSIPGVVCEERATKPARLRAAARRGAAARGICFVATPRRYTPISPASRRFASARPALAPKCKRHSLTGPYPVPAVNIKSKPPLLGVCRGLRRSHMVVAHCTVKFPAFFTPFCGKTAGVLFVIWQRPESG